MQIRSAFQILFLLLMAGTSAEASENWFTFKEKESLAVIGNVNQIGYLEPCGCRKVPIGGVVRRWNAISALDSQRVIQVDAGNLLYPSTFPPRGISAIWKAQAESVLGAYEKLGVDAFTPGPNDFALGPQTLIDMTTTAKVPTVSSNVVWRKNNNDLFPSFRSFTRGGKKIFVTGISGLTTAFAKDIRFTDPTEALKKVLETKAAKEADLKILLTTFDLEGIKKILGKLSTRVDVVVYDNGEDGATFSQLFPETVAISTMRKGQGISAAEINLTEGKWSLTHSASKELNLDFSRNTSDSANPMPPLVRFFKSEVRRLDQLGALKRAAGKVEIKETHAFNSFIQCAKCHRRQRFFQNGRPHAAAFLTLVRTEAVNKSDCLRCHSLGQGSKRGFSSASEALIDYDGKPVDYKEVLKTAGLTDIAGQELSYRLHRKKIREDVVKWQRALKKHGVERALVGVQCEHCHNPKENHPASDALSPDKFAQNRCLQCHTQEQSPEWYAKDGSPKADVVSRAISQVACIK